MQMSLYNDICLRLFLHVFYFFHRRYIFHRRLHRFPQIYFSPQITQIFADENNINISIRANPRKSAFQKIIICVICGELF